MNQGISQMNQAIAQIHQAREGLKNLPKDFAEFYAFCKSPLVSVFNNRKTTDALGKCGFKTYHVRDKTFRDYPLLADQTIILIDYQKLQDAWQKDRTQKRKSDFKENKLQWETELANWEKAKADREAKIAEWDSNEAKFNNYIKKLEKLKGSKLTEIEIFKITKKFATNKEPRPIEWDETLNPKPQKPTGGKRKFEIDQDSLSNLVLELLEDLKENGLDFTLVSSSYRKNPKNKNHICFWLVETWKYKKLEEYGRIVVQKWDFAT